MYNIYIKLLISAFLFFVFVLNLNSQSVKDFGINIRSSFDTTSRKVTFKWDSDTNTFNFFIYKKKRQDSLFGNYIAKLPKDQLEWTDTLFDNIEYEYKIEKDANKYYSYGYIIAGLNIQEKDYYGTCLILVDSTIYQQITNELDNFISHIRADGWSVIVKQAPRAEQFDSQKVQKTKSIILQTNDEVQDLTSIILIGRIPVPYSGNFAVDGHEDHYGAWPTDIYYAELNGKWTDTLTSRYDNVPSRTLNLPDDGKFDQTYLTSDLELQMGRIDMFNLPFFKESEVELLKRYLVKISKFKNGNTQISKRAGIIDNFGPGYKEGFATSGWTNFYSLMGGDSVFYLKDRYELQKQDYMWYYGCGPGAYLASHEALYSEELAKSPHYVAFNLIFGSYNGDWDSENNLLRSAIASQPLGFTAVWAGRPHWFFHHLGFAYNIGYSTKLTQNAYPANYTAVSPFARRMNHIALMGDPTLRMSYFQKPTNLKIEYVNNGVEIKWDYPESNGVTFNIYRSDNLNGKFEKINSEPINSRSFIDKSPNLGANIYQIRARRLENAQAGTYFNLSLGEFSEPINYPDNFGKEIIISPNPFNDYINIILKDGDIINRIEIYDSQGLKLGEHLITLNNQIQSLKFSDLVRQSVSQGLYFIRIISNKGFDNYKIIKIK